MIDYDEHLKTLTAEQIKIKDSITDCLCRIAPIIDKSEGNKIIVDIMMFNDIVRHWYLNECYHDPNRTEQLKAEYLSLKGSLKRFCWNDWEFILK